MQDVGRGGTKLTLRQVLVALNSKKQPFGYATAGAATYLFASVLADTFSLFLNLVVFGMLYAMYSAIYIYNDIVDRDIDRINSKDRPLVTGDVTTRQAKKMAASLFIVASLLTLLASYFGPIRELHNYLAILGTASFAVFLGIIYSHPRVYLKKKFPFKSVSIATGAGLASLIGWAISGADFSLAVLLSASSTSAILFAMSILFDLRDLKGDRLHSVRTFPIVLGVSASCRLMCFSLAIPACMAAMIAILSVERIGPIALGILAAVSIIGIRTLSKLRTNPEDKRTFASSVTTMRRLYYLTQLGIGSLAIGNSVTFH